MLLVIENIAELSLMRFKPILPRKFSLFNSSRRVQPTMKFSDFDKIYNAQLLPQEPSYATGKS